MVINHRARIGRHDQQPHPRSGRHQPAQVHRGGHYVVAARVGRLLLPSGYPAGLTIGFQPSLRETPHRPHRGRSGARGLARRSCLRPAPRGPRPRARHATGFPARRFARPCSPDRAKDCRRPTASARPPETRQQMHRTQGAPSRADRAGSSTSTREPRRRGRRVGRCRGGVGAAAASVAGLHGGSAAVRD